MTRNRLMNALMIVFAGWSVSLVMWGCGSSEPPLPEDARGLTPDKVVLHAYQAAVAGDYNEANRYVTATFKLREQAGRERFDAGETSMMQESWPWRVRRIEDPNDLVILSQELVNSETASVTIKVGKRIPIVHEVTMDDGGEWRITLHGH